MNLSGHCIVVGASHAGVQVALQLRRQGWQGAITLIGGEAALPYHRPPLSKAVMAGERELEQILLRPPAMYTQSDVTLRLATRVTAIDPAQKQVTLQDGESLGYDRLVLCTGSRVIHLPLGEGLSGMHYLRSIDDVQDIRSELAPGKRAVVIGGGYIGLEAAAVLNKLGLQVTVLERSARLLPRVTGEQVSAYLQALHQAQGVRIVCNAQVTGINGAGAVESVSCEDGSRHAADLVIVGIGVLPETALAEAAGLQVENGIYVDAGCRSSDPAIYAAGDCTSHPSLLYGRRVRLESVQNANDQARVVAANLCGAEQQYDALPWFWSDQYDMKLQSAGLCQGYDSTEVLGDIRPEPAASFSVLYFAGERLVAADCINQARVFMQCKQLVTERASRAAALAALAAL